MDKSKKIENIPPLPSLPYCRDETFQTNQMVDTGMALIGVIDSLEVPLSLVSDGDIGGCQSDREEWEGTPDRKSRCQLPFWYHIWWDIPGKSRKAQ